MSERAPHIVGVRHHSPACARLVRHLIAERKPTHILIEGPADLNPRLGEFLLGHELPVAVFSYIEAEHGSHAASPNRGRPDG